MYVLQVIDRLLAASLALDAASCASYRKIMCRASSYQRMHVLRFAWSCPNAMILMNLFLSWVWLQGCIMVHPEYGALLLHIMGVFFGRETPQKVHGLTSSSPRTTQEASKLRARVGPTQWVLPASRFPPKRCLDSRSVRLVFEINISTCHLLRSWVRSLCDREGDSLQQRS
jgi:hypothetical protein